MPAAVLSVLTAVLLGLVCAVVKPVRGSAGEVLFWTWPWFFAAAGVIAGGLAALLAKAPATLFGAGLSRRESSALCLAVLAGAGWITALVVTVVVPVKPGLDKQTQSMAFLVIGLGIGVLLGAVAAPTFVNALLARMRVASVIVTIADGLLFIAGALGVFLLLREGVVPTALGWPVLILGALLFSPIGMWLSHKLLFAR